MDRRVFQPRTDSRAERRRNALSLAALVLLAGWLWLHSHSATVPAPKNVSIPAQPSR